MTFHESKPIIRKALSEASDAKLVELLDDARAGKVPFGRCETCICGHLIGPDWDADDLPTEHPRWILSSAYAELSHLPNGHWLPIRDDDARRQRVLVPMILAEIRRRGRVAVAVEPACVEAMVR